MEFFDGWIGAKEMVGIWMGICILLVLGWGQKVRYHTRKFCDAQCGKCGSGKTLAILAEDCGATHPEWSSQSVLSEHIHRKSNASSEGRSSRSLPSDSSPGIRLEVYDTSF